MSAGTWWASEAWQIPLPVPFVASPQTPFSVEAVPVGSTGNALVSLPLWNPFQGVTDLVGGPHVYMTKQLQRSQWVGRSLRLCHPSLNLGNANPQVVAVNMLPPQDAELHRENSMNSCTSSLPAHFSFFSREEFTIHASGAHAPIKWNLGPNHTWPQSPETQWQCSTGYAVSPPRTKSETYSMEVVAVITLRKPGEKWSARTVYRWAWD